MLSLRCTCDSILWNIPRSHSSLTALTFHFKPLLVTALLTLSFSQLVTPAAMDVPTVCRPPRKSRLIGEIFFTARIKTVTGSPEMLLGKG